MDVKHTLTCHLHVELNNILRGLASVNARVGRLGGLDDDPPHVPL